MPVDGQPEQDIGVYSCNDIIKNDPDPSLNPPVYSSCGGWLYYIQNPEKKESSR